MCDKYNIGVTLVPTIVRGINDHQIGDVIRLGASLSPAVRGVHFQPVSYIGRYPFSPAGEDRFTLDELYASIGEQTDMDLSCLLPSRCDHPLCGFHGSFIVEDGVLVPLGRADTAEDSGQTSARQNREYVGRRWKREREDCEGAAQEGGDAATPGSARCGEDSPEACCETESESFDAFLRKVKKHGFTVSAMAFQDAMNLDVERLRLCSLRVYREGALVPFCVRYMTPIGGRGDS
jgi:hypothetical protein